MKTSYFTIAAVVLGTALAGAAQGHGKMGHHRGAGAGPDGPGSDGPRGKGDHTSLATRLELTEAQQVSLEALRTQLAESHESLAADMKAARDGILTEEQVALLEASKPDGEQRGRRHGPRIDLGLTETQAEQLQGIREQFHAAMQAQQAELQQGFVSTLSEEQQAILGERSVLGPPRGRMHKGHGPRGEAPADDETAAAEDIEAVPGAAKTAATALQQTGWGELKRQHGTR